MLSHVTNPESDFFGFGIRNPRLGKRNPNTLVIISHEVKHQQAAKVLLTVIHPFRKPTWAAWASLWAVSKNFSVATVNNATVP